MTTVGVDIGGSTTELVRLDGDGEVEARALVATRPGELLVPGTVDAVRSLVLGASLDRIGVGVPGQVDPTDGSVRLAVNLGLGTAPIHLGRELSEAFALPVVVENDVRAAALGAHVHLVPDAEVLVLLSVGTGVSAGVVIGGRLHRGRSGMAGEIGHVVVDPNGPLCACGLNGCLEVLVSGAAIRARWGRGGGTAAADLFTAAAAGDRTARRIAGEVADRLANAVHWLVLAYGADHVVLGGGVGSVGGPLLAAVHERLDDMASRSEIAGRLLGRERVTSAPADLPLGALGAAAVAQRQAHEGRAEAPAGS